MRYDLVGAAEVARDVESGGTEYAARVTVGAWDPRTGDRGMGSMTEVSLATPGVRTVEEARQPYGSLWDASVVVDEAHGVSSAGDVTTLRLPQGALIYEASDDETVAAVIGSVQALRPGERVSIGLVGRAAFARLAGELVGQQQGMPDADPASLVLRRALGRVDFQE